MWVTCLNLSQVSSKLAAKSVLGFHIFVDTSTLIKEGNWNRLQLLYYLLKDHVVSQENYKQKLKQYNHKLVSRGDLYKE